jgi:DNA-binding HxlR family transcriptional regulator
MKLPADYAQKFDRLQDDCPVRAALDVVRGRWKPSILFELKTRARRFSELQAALPEITAQTLTLQLRQLEADGIVSRTVYPEVPARVEYALSEFGATLGAMMDQLEAWGAVYLARRKQAKTQRT